MLNPSSVGVVVIGRNEGERLKRCIQSVIDVASKVVYVDSGSTDGSAGWVSQQSDVELESLDMTQPFTAARARNHGFARLMDVVPDIEYVQFVDGDCEVVAGWIVEAQAFLEENEDAAVVCGRRRERYPDQSIYNRLCDIEWDTPTGEATSCGGDAMIRAEIFSAVSGYRPEVIAGEEPELCFRIRAQGCKIWRIGRDMTLHDAQMTRFGQWWRRSKRCGYAYALGASIHGKSSERFRVKEVLRILFWGLCIPIAIFALLVVSPLFVGLLVVYAVQFLRLRSKSNAIQVHSRSVWAFFNVLGKFPELLGVTKFMLDYVLGRRSKIIEYK